LTTSSATISISGLARYIAGAAVIAFTLDFCAQPFGTGLNASGRISLQSETAQPLHIVCSHKGDRLPGGQQTYGQAASGDVTIGNRHYDPRRRHEVTRRDHRASCRNFRMAANLRSVR